MDQVDTTYSVGSTASHSEYYRNFRRNSGRVETAAIQNGRAERATQAVVPYPNSSTQNGIQKSTPREQEFLPYGPDGRREGEKRSSLVSDPNGESKNTTSGAGKKEDPQLQQEISRLRANEAKVKAHEAAHKAAGGTMTGPVSYTYTIGPDGKSYVTGGEVPISVTPGRTPQETVSRMQQVIRAALAPADPSPQDRVVASQAAASALKAQQQESAPDTPGSSASLTNDGAAGSGAAGEVKPVNSSKARPGTNSNPPSGIIPSRSTDPRSASQVSFYA